jgi:lysozyme family protein
MMFSKLANRIREIAAVADVRPRPKPDTIKRMNENLNKALEGAPVYPAPEKAKADLAKPPLEKPAQISNSLPPVTHPDRFNAALKIVLKHEGGYINHKLDPGGRTNLGVTQRVWEAWSGKPATETEMRGLTVDMVAPLYRKKYWDKVRAPELPAGLDLHVFDFGVNAGPARAIRYLQMMVGSSPDGIWGPATKRALGNYVQQYGAAKAITRYGELREQYYRQLRTFPTFGRGWLRRNREVTASALDMAA